MAELYKFTDGLQSLGFSPHLFSEVWEGVTYTPIPITRSSISITGNLVKSQVTFTLPSTNSFGLRRVFDLPDVGWYAQIYEDKVLLWTGRVISAGLSGSKISIITDSTERINSRNPTGARVALHCWKTLFSSTCGADRNWTKSTYPATAVGKIVTLSTPQELNRYAGGIIEKAGESRAIIRNSGVTLEIASPFSTAASVLGDADIYPGCNLTSYDCLLHNNLNNFGGFEFIPLTNPMERSGLL